MMSRGTQGLAMGWRVRILALIGASALALAISAAASATRASAAAPEKTDIMFIFDTSGSMEGVLEEAKEEIKTLVANTEASLPNAEFGVADVEDVPGYFSQPLESFLTEKLKENEYEEDSEKPWHLWQPLTSNEEEVEKAINELSGSEVAHSGGDLPEAYGRALYETATNPQVKWRAGARHEIVLIADNVPHTPNVNEGIPPEFWLVNPFETGEEPPGNFGIKETQWKEGESLEFHKTLQKLNEEEKPLAMVNYFHTSESESENYIHYWEYWAADTGGQAIVADEGAKTLDSKLEAIIKESAEGIPPCPPGFERTAKTPCVKKPTKPTTPPPPPPPPPPVPNSGFTIQSIVENTNGTVTITFVPTQSGEATLVVTVPTASIASTSATDAKAKKCKKGQVKIKGKCLPPTTTAGTTSAAGTAGVPLKLTVNLSSKIKAQLKRGKTVHLTATLTYTSSLGGTPTVQVDQVTIKGKRAHHHR
jgi:hypothetical protein